MATNLTGNTIASTYEKLIKRADTYVAAGVNIEVQDDSAAAAASSLYLDITNGNVGIGDTLPDEAKLSITGVTSGDVGIKIDQDNNNGSLYIDAESTSATVVEIDAGTATTGIGLSVTAGSLDTGSAAIFTTGSTDLASTAAGGFVEILSTGDTDTNVNNLLFIKNDHASSSGTIPLFIDQDANNASIKIDSEATTNHALFFDTPTTTSGAVILVNDCDSITSGSAFQVQCAAGSLETGAAAGLIKVNYTGNSTATSNLMYLKNDHADADDTVGLYIHQDGADACIEFSGAGGGGIKFNSSAMSSSDANTLDDYEEGTFTPLIIDTTGTPVVATMHGSGHHGHYTKIGQTVFVSAFVETTAWSSPSGNVRIKGFPFTHATVDNSDYQSFAVASFAGLNMAAAHSVHFRLDRGEVIGSLYLSDATAGLTTMLVAEWPALGGQVAVSGFYKIA
jgi:hypothetical protein